MDEEHFLSSLRCLNSNSLEEFYEKSLSPKKRMGFQVTLFKLLIRNYSPLMVIYAFFITIYTNLMGLFVPEYRNNIPDFLTNTLKVKSWYYNNPDSCSIVAVIKAVQARYADDIFKSNNKDFIGNHIIELKDDTRVTITSDELQMVKQKVNFSGPDNKDKENAYLCFAVIAKNAVIKGDFNSISNAVNFFNSGSAPEYCAEMLGYINYIMLTDPMRGLNDIVVAYSDTHAVCINNGFIEGQGEKLIFAGHDTMGKVLNNAIVIV